MSAVPTYLLNMLGLGPLAEALQNPEAQQQILNLMAGIVETSRAVQRIEQKLDMLLAEHNLGQASYPPAILEPPIGHIEPSTTGGSGNGR